MILLALPAAASASVVELGALPRGARGGCPLHCQAVGRTTAYQVKVGPDRTPYRAPADGRIVAWTVALGKPGPSQTATFTRRMDGSPQAAVVVLSPGPKLTFRAATSSPVITLTPYLGRTVQFPLVDALPIKKGQVLALSVPTWAPLVESGVGTDTSWRSNRARTDCAGTSTPAAFAGVPPAGLFACFFAATRLTYSATFIPTPAITAISSAAPSGSPDRP